MKIIPAAKALFPKITNLLLLCFAAGTRDKDQVSTNYEELSRLFHSYQELLEENQAQSALIEKLRNEAAYWELFASELYDRYDKADEYIQ